MGSFLCSLSGIVEGGQLTAGNEKKTPDWVSFRFWLRGWDLNLTTSGL